MVQIKAIEKTAAGAAQAETVAIQIKALENRIEDLQCYRCPDALFVYGQLRCVIADN